ITVLSALATTFSVAPPASPTTLIVQPANAFQEQCTPEAKDALYKSFRNSFQTDLAKAYEAATKYVACPEPPDLPEDQKKIINYFKRWCTAYEQALRKTRLRQLLYNEKKYPEAYSLGKQILASEPDDLEVLIDLGANCYMSPQNPQLTAACIQYATKALRLLESGKTLDDWSPLGSKDAAIAYLNYSIGALTLQTEPANALKHLLKAAQFETRFKKSPYTYAMIAQAYEAGPYATQSEAYKTRISGPPEGPETRLALANINQLVDRMIDALARAVALAGDDPKFNKPKVAWMGHLSDFYKYRLPSDTRMNEMINGILSKPLPPEPTPITSLPSSTPASKPE
ncbi:MAG TPA: hypothetical protein VF251_10310, partial [Pyrinomonadaceae bacterium]